LLKIYTIEEYEYCVKRGYEPLYDAMFDLSFTLRFLIQNDLFFGTVPERNQRYYLWNWKHKKHRCEECNSHLSEYSASFISHILPRSSYPELAFDPRNNNILCLFHHAQWESEEKRKTMRIYDKNMQMIERLKNELIKRK